MARAGAASIARLLLGGAAVFAMMTVASAPSRASTFDSATGTVALDGGARSWNLDSLQSLPASLVLSAEDANGSALEQSDVQSRFSASAQTIEGRAGLYLGKGLERLGFTLDSGLAGRRILVSFWQKPRGVAAQATLVWRVHGARDFYVGMMRLLPTGRRTDDGWYELSSGPFDFALGGRIAPTLSVRVERGEQGYGPQVSTDPDATTLVDALDIVDLGPAAVPDATCTLATESAGACGAVGTCHFGRCADSAAVFGQLPFEPIRGEYLDRRIFEIRTFNGNRVLDHTWDAYLASMEQARAATAPMAFWTAVGDAYEEIGDGHGSPPTTGYTERPAIGMCAHLGEADRLPPAADGSVRKVPLIFTLDSSIPLVADLQVGDALVSVDGVPVEQWKAMAAKRLRHYGSPNAREVQIAPSIPAAAMRLGAKMTFARCAGEAYDGPCTPEHVTTIDVDTVEAGGGPLWSGDASSWVDETLGCDMRFKRLNSDRPDDSYMRAESADDGEVRIVDFNGVPDFSWSADWKTRIAAGLQATASKFLLDERTGYGGVFDAVDLIANPFFDPTSTPIAEVFPVLNRRLDADTREAIVGCSSANGECGGFIYFTPGISDSARDNFGTSPNAKVALLVSKDVSGNDYLTRLLKFRPNTRVFGPCTTFGAFGSIYDLPTYLGEMSGGSSQMGDSLIYLGAPPQSYGTFESGPGVAPDTTVFQTQSDLMAGRDTLVEAAKAWLRQP